MYVYVYTDVCTLAYLCMTITGKHTCLQALWQFKKQTLVQQMFVVNDLGERENERAEGRIAKYLSGLHTF